MSLYRTQSGLSSEYLFWNTDIVVYLEGGESLSNNDIKEGKYTECSPDIHYWQSLFEVYKPSVKCKFKSIGSKENVKVIAENISQGATHTIAAMDRDFDNINEEKLAINNVMYTYGYSWENDAWNEYSIIEYLYQLIGACRTTLNDEVSSIHEFFEKLFLDLKTAISTDLVLISRHSESFFDRKSYQKYIQINNDKYPTINNNELNKSFEEVKEKFGDSIIHDLPTDNISLSDCFGHLFESYAYRLLSYILKLKDKKAQNIPKDYAVTGIVNSFCKLLHTNDSLSYLNNHYKNEFSRILMSDSHIL